MNTERLLQLSISMMAALATLMLGTSQDSSSLPVLGVIVAMLSFTFTDLLEWFRLNRFLGGALGISALLYSFVQSRGGGIEAQFISVANLLIHLQMILLFQRKDRRVYWQLMVLSLMQVVVAAALNLFFLFAPLLILYTVLALAALLLFFIYRETEPYLESRLDRSSKNNSIRIESVRDIDRSDVTPLSVRRPRRDLLRRSFTRHFALVAISTALVSASVFLLMPRFGDGVWRTKNSRAKTGYSSEVDLDDNTSLYESPAVVMRISLVQEATKQPYLISNDPYLRGGILSEYGNGKWRRDRKPESSLVELRKPSRIYSAVRLVVNMERQRGGIVFSLSPPCGLEDISPSLEMNQTTHEVIYNPQRSEDGATYSIGTLGLRNGLQTEFVPQRSVEIHLDRWKRDVRQNLRELTALADKIIADANLTDASPLVKARRLETYFTNSGLFKYSLDPAPNRNASDDPVQDFVINHRTGHCQYFASALAIMLRSQGIPSRIVLGYHGGIYNAVGNYYQIRELDAHAWVEAVIPAADLPDDEIMPTEGLDGDAWVRLDPTPSIGSNLNVAAVGAWRTKFNDGIDYLQLLWSEYVLGLNEKRQREVIYEPIRKTFRSLTTYFFSFDRWSERLEALQSRFQGDFFSRENARDGVLAIVVLTTLFYVLRFAFRITWVALRHWWGSRTRTTQPMVEFYRDFESMLALQGIVRSHSQTHYEFAVAATERLQTRLPHVAHIPLDVVKTFYQIRFGGSPISAETSQEMGLQLRQLQSALHGQLQNGATSTLIRS